MFCLWLKKVKRREECVCALVLMIKPEALAVEEEKVLYCLVMPLNRVMVRSEVEGKARKIDPLVQRSPSWRQVVAEEFVRGGLGSYPIVCLLHRAPITPLDVCIYA